MTGRERAQRWRPAPRRAEMSRLTGAMMLMMVDYSSLDTIFWILASSNVGTEHLIVMLAVS
ncbi:hypothetical protein BP00DRAFT_251325 [Aspergillus indologenus CBS 114.80]|uniref:Uncharacterized protein n=1 Tax=Aspergillus indologenus CBS 114.80 TaxID=1450541 RepID=A0A2V5HWF7_9EURO|nr:hypothetical protein BP00DRAFT_251325 [Aspergillus indologenus CBS 114.80]